MDFNIIDHLKLRFDDNIMNEIKLCLIGNFNIFYNEEYIIKKNICYIENYNIFDDTLKFLVLLVNNNIFIDKIVLQTKFLNNNKLEILHNINNNNKFEEDIDEDEVFRISILYNNY